MCCNINNLYTYLYVQNKKTTIPEVNERKYSRDCNEDTLYMYTYCIYYIIGI